MKSIGYVILGSALGGLLRYLGVSVTKSWFNTSFPLGTLFVNLLGCFLIGCLWGISEKMKFSSELRLFIFTGFLGGFTTFSAFSNETFLLVQNGFYGQAFIYVGLSVGLGLTLTALGAICTP